MLTGYSYLYAHMDPDTMKKEGVVSKGEYIGNVGPKYISHGPYKDRTRKLYKWTYNRITFTLWNNA